MLWELILGITLGIITLFHRGWKEWRNFQKKCLNTLYEAETQITQQNVKEKQKSENKDFWDWVNEK